MADLVTNKKIHLDYEILEKFDAGIELLGFEVKALRAGNASLEGSHITVRGSEVFLIGTHISPYQQNNTPKDYDPDRNRRLLMTHDEIRQIASQESKKGLTIVPISVYNRERKIKVSLAIVRGKKKFDKRETLKKKETDRDIRRTLKNE